MNKELSLIDVEANAMQKEIFYTALYHCFIHPNTISDVNGDYINSNGEKCNMEGKNIIALFHCGIHIVRHIHCIL